MNRKRLKRKLHRWFNMKMLMTYFIVILMMGSAMGFVMTYNFGGSNVTYYDGHRIRQGPQSYEVAYEGEDLEFFHMPQELLSLDVPDGAMSALASSSHFTVSRHPNITDTGETDYAMFVLFDYLSRIDKIVGVGTLEEDLTRDFNVISCEDSTIQSPVVAFKEAEENEVTFDEENGCIEVHSADVIHRIRVAERMTYELLGIIEPGMDEEDLPDEDQLPQETGDPMNVPQ